MSSGVTERKPINTTRTLVTGLEESSPPLDLGAPPHVMPILMTARHSALDEPVTAEVIAIFDDLVMLLRMLLFRRSARSFRRSELREFGGEGNIPDEPGATVSMRAVLPPCTEMVAAGNALPARPPVGKVCLSGEVFFRSAAVSVAQICLVYVAHV